MWSGGRESLALLCGIPDQRQAENPYSLSQLVLGGLALPSLMASSLKALPLTLPAAKDECGSAQEPPAFTGEGSREAEATRL